MALIIIGLVVLGIAVCYFFVKAVNAIFNPLINKMDRKRIRLEKRDNPYVQAHLMRRNNDEMYEEYLNWMDKTGGGLPVDKIKTREEVEFEKKMNS